MKVEALKIQGFKPF